MRPLGAVILFSGFIFAIRSMHEDEDEGPFWLGWFFGAMVLMMIAALTVTFFMPEYLCIYILVLPILGFVTWREWRKETRPVTSHQAATRYQLECPSSRFDLLRSA
jgi:hypothetical protein